MTFNFKKAEARPEFLRIGLAGPSTSGKTVSAIRMASGFVRGTGKRILLIDTENGRSLKYAKHFDFDHVDLSPPFTSARYLEILLAAEKAGYGAIIIDQLSSEHEGPGGVLEQHEKFLKEKAGDDWKKREQLKFTAWIEPKSQRNRLIQMGVQRVNADLILCFRAKEKIDLSKKDANGKTKVGNAGWTPIGGEEFPFEMLSVMVLPPKSAGKPDWEEQSSTINSMDKDLIKLLHGIQQIDENLGAEMKRLTGVTAPVATTGAQESQPETTHTPPATQELTSQQIDARKVASAINKSASAIDLNDLWTVDYLPEIRRLEKEKPEFVVKLKKQFDDKMAEFKGAE